MGEISPPTKPQQSTEEFWIFGYGSLIWKPPPHFDLRVPGYIEGYVRRFWQASEDHRGTPTAPGRVVTLIEHSYWESLGEKTEEEEEDHPVTTRVHGAAYRIPPAHIPAVTAYLDIREINGYSIEYTTFYPLPGALSDSPTTPIRRCLLYIGLPSNPQFLGLQTAGEVAGVIAESEGPSGRNCEYLFRLEEALGEMGGEDGHVRVLGGLVRELLEGGKGEKGGREGERVGNGKGGEETEKVG